MLTVQRVAAADLTDATPASAFVGFPECLNTVVAVEDVRLLGLEKARDYCQRKDTATVGAVAGTATVFAAVVLLILRSLQIG